MKASVDKLKERWWFKLSLGIYVYVMGTVGTICAAIPLLLLRLVAMATAPPHLARIVSPESGLTSVDDYWGQPKHAVVGLHYTLRPVSKEIVMATMNNLIQKGKVTLSRNHKIFP